MPNAHRKMTKISDVVVFGGGRWARAYILELDKILDNPVNIYVVSENNEAGMSQWVEEAGFSRKINVADNIVRFDRLHFDLCFIVNNALRHFHAAIQVIDSSNILVEKPVCIDPGSIKLLADMSRVRDKFFCVSQVFRFSMILHKFRGEVCRSYGDSELTVHWADASNARRYGEIKTYDPAISIIEDVIPHVVSILIFMGFDVSLRLGDMKVLRGGAEVQFLLHADQFKLRVVLAREAISRKRSLTFFSERGTSCCDFDNSVMPDGSLQRMLEAFVKSIEDCSYDHRLNWEDSYTSAVLTSEIMPEYRKLQIEWLALMIKDYDPGYGNDVSYAIREIVLSKVNCDWRVLRDDWAETFNSILCELLGGKLNSEKSGLDSMIWNIYKKLTKSRGDQ